VKHVDGKPSALFNTYLTPLQCLAFVHSIQVDDLFHAHAFTCGFPCLRPLVPAAAPTTPCLWPRPAMLAAIDNTTLHIDLRHCRIRQHHGLRTSKR
jgi:hypothetical protein